MSMRDRRSFLRPSLSLASAAVAGRAVSAALPPSAALGLIKIRDVETVLLRFPPGRFTADAIQTFGSEHGGLVVNNPHRCRHYRMGLQHVRMIRGGPNVVVPSSMKS